MSNGKKYYGGFFWVSIVSFVIPFVVAAKAFELAAPLTEPDVNVDASGVDHKIWDYLLKQYVADGLIDYKGIKKNKLFDLYIEQIANCDVEKLSHDERLALACNAYNALVVNSVIKHHVEKSVQDVTEKEGEDFFKIEEHVFHGDTMSLDQLEKEIILPVFQDPRVHVALVCAARSCPAIRPEAYFGDRIEQQLDDQSALFANNSNYVHFDEQKNVLQMSKILQWYGSDFDQKYGEQGHLKWILKFTDPGNQSQRDAIAAAIDGQMTQTFFDYDWALNSQVKPKGAVKGDFGSGGGPTE